MQSYPLHSLIEGSWFKLICGASYQHLPAVRSLALAYSLAGADCIDVAADPAVIAAAREGINAAQKLKLLKSTEPSTSRSVQAPPFEGGDSSLPWLMVSINDGEDPHFRKAKFDVTQCPTDCPQPCVRVCPAEAINLSFGGVLDSLCYGCGRCVPICPQELIVTRSYLSSLEQIVPWIESMAVDAIEIHTQVGHYHDFKRVWKNIFPVVGQLKLLAISCTDGENVIDYLRSLYELISPLPCPLIWQTDGRSMSGDIGKGTTHAAIAFAQKVLQAQLPGYIQLAGGTNDYTVDKLKQAKMLGRQDLTSTFKLVSGLAYGSYARAILSSTIAKLETTELPEKPANFKSQPMNQLNLKLEQNRELLQEAVGTAKKLVSQIKNSH
ncbi:MAG TPA: LdpA C-terminal domain-containing domain [Coleofasciculaceae cyanobacterium]|jgi:Fe-S-cluster-containing hydrogenase component 2